jgi:hypothetical protein
VSIAFRLITRFVASSLLNPFGFLFSSVNQGSFARNAPPAPDAGAGGLGETRPDFNSAESAGQSSNDAALLAALKAFFLLNPDWD